MRVEPHSLTSFLYRQSSCVQRSVLLWRTQRSSNINILIYTHTLAHIHTYTIITYIHTHNIHTHMHRRVLACWQATTLSSLPTQPLWSGRPIVTIYSNLGQSKGPLTAVCSLTPSLCLSLTHLFSLSLSPREQYTTHDTKSTILLFFGQFFHLWALLRQSIYKVVHFYFLFCFFFPYSCMPCYSTSQKASYVYYSSIASCHPLMLKTYKLVQCCVCVCVYASLASCLQSPFHGPACARTHTHTVQLGRERQRQRVRWVGLEWLAVLLLNNGQ